jgi:hypothetical protein
VNRAPVDRLFRLTVLFGKDKGHQRQRLLLVVLSAQAQLVHARRVDEMKGGTERVILGQHLLRFDLTNPNKISRLTTNFFMQ